MRRKPTVDIRTPGQGAEPEPEPGKTSSQPEPRADDRIALTVKLSPHDYQRLMALRASMKARGMKGDASTQALLERAVLQLLSENGS